MQGMQTGLAQPTHRRGGAVPVASSPAWGRTWGMAWRLAWETSLGLGLVLFLGMGLARGADQADTQDQGLPAQASSLPAPDPLAQAGPASGASGTSGAVNTSTAAAKPGPLSLRLQPARAPYTLALRQTGALAELHVAPVHLSRWGWAPRLLGSTELVWPGGHPAHAYPVSAVQPGLWALRTSGLGGRAAPPLPLGDVIALELGFKTVKPLEQLRGGMLVRLDLGAATEVSLRPRSGRVLVQLRSSW